MKYWKQVEDRLILTNVFSHYGIQPNRADFVCCPFHNEKTPSMKIYKKNYHCFGCHITGGAINLVSHLFGLDFKESCHKLNNDFNLGVIIDRKETKEERKQRLHKEQVDKNKKLLFDKLESVANGIVEPSDVQMKNYFAKTVEYQTNNDDWILYLVSVGILDYISVDDLLEVTQPRTIKKIKYNTNLFKTNWFDKYVTRYIKRVKSAVNNAQLKLKILKKEEDILNGEHN